MSNNYKINPSDLTFLYDECKHCFFNKVKYGITRPSIPIPGVFSTIAALQKEYFSDKRTEVFCPELPPGTVIYGEKRVQSMPVSFEGMESTCYITGRFDIVIQFDDRTYAVVDFKTANPHEEKSAMYGRQLHAYSYALENPEVGAMSLRPISTLGLLYFMPDTCGLVSDERIRQILEGNLQWVEIKRNDDDFLKFLREIVVLLDGEIPPPDPVNCDWCRYRKLIGEL
jgi:hypothetical protein